MLSIDSVVGSDGNVLVLWALTKIGPRFGESMDVRKKI
jgi:hypothetical protein